MIQRTIQKTIKKGFLRFRLRKAYLFEARGTGIECSGTIRKRINNGLMILVVLLDPYAPMVSSGRKYFGEEHKARKERDRPNPPDMLGTYDFKSKPFDWANVDHPRINEEDSVVYEMTVRAFTREDESMNENIRGPS